MNPITDALADLRFNIPKQILEKTFFSLVDPRTPIAISLDARIRDLVIEARVMKDCNLLGGNEAVVNLDGLHARHIDLYSAIYMIPKDRTQGRTITRALSVMYGPGNMVGGNYYMPGQSSALMMAGSAVMQSSAPIPNVSTARVQLIGENTVLISDTALLSLSMQLRCWIENDTNMNHLEPTSYKVFSQLVEYAVKAYIYINSQIPMDIGFIHSGQELGRYKDIVDSYSDANDNYKTLLNEKWRKVALLNDYEAKRRHLTASLGGGW